MTSVERRVRDRSSLDPMFERAGDALDCLERLRRPYRRLASDGSVPAPVVLFGAGAWGRHTATRLREAGMPAVAFADNAPDRWGSHVVGLPVLSPAEAAARYADEALFVTTIYNGASARRQLEAIGCRKVLDARSFYFGLSDVFIPYYQLDRPEKIIDAREAIGPVGEAWDDERSKVVFASRLAVGLGLPADRCEAVGSPRDCYFDPQLVRIDRHDRVVDCGAFDGDTIRRLLRDGAERPARLVALEPDPANAAALRDYVASLDAATGAIVEVIEAAASSSTGEIAFDASGTVAAHAGTGAARVKSIALDGLAGRVRPTFVKMDIEGHEYDALRGLRASIRDHPPVLAISLYHRSDDLWRIPRLIKETNPTYRLFLRCYAEDGWESVCYAIPPARDLPFAMEPR